MSDFEFGSRKQDPVRQFIRELDWFQDLHMSEWIFNLVQTISWNRASLLSVVTNWPTISHNPLPIIHTAAMLVLSIASLLLLLCHSTAAQEAVDDIPTTMLSYLETPSRGWTIQTGSRVETEVVLSPAKDLLLVAGNDCSMTAISLDGIEQWKYTSSTSLEGCDGGILFGTTVDQVNYAARAIPNVGRLER